MTRYRQAVHSAQTGRHCRALSLGSVVDDLLGLRLDEPYVGYLAARYAHAFSSPGTTTPSRCRRRILPSRPGCLTAFPNAEADPEAFVRFLRHRPRTVSVALRRSRLCDRSRRNLPEGRAAIERPDWEQRREEFRSPIAAASEGRIAPVLSRPLGRVRRLEGGLVELDDIHALAAWCLSELLRSGPVAISTCPQCGSPWLPDRDATYCRRPAPGHVASCRQVAKKKARFVGKNRGFHLERKKLYERTRRGTLDRADYDAWASENLPAEWTPFAQWQAERATTATTQQRSQQPNRKEEG